MSSKNFPNNRNNQFTEMLFPLFWLIFTKKAKLPFYTWIWIRLDVQAVGFCRSGDALSRPRFTSGNLNLHKSRDLERAGESGRTCFNWRCRCDTARRRRRTCWTWRRYSPRTRSSVASARSSYHKGARQHRAQITEGDGHVPQPH